jgi:hypothetical protein
MKIENLKKAEQLNRILKAIDEALVKSKKFLSERSFNSFGHELANSQGLYQLHLAEYRDMSGNYVDLTNCGIGIEVLQLVEIQLELKREKIVKEIEAL